MLEANDQTSTDTDSTNTDKLIKLLDDELIKERIRQTLSNNVKPSKWNTFTSNPLTSVVVAFILTGLLGGFFTYYLNLKIKDHELFVADQRQKSDKEWEKSKINSDREWNEKQKLLDIERNKKQMNLEHVRYIHQRELDRQRSFADEINKTRVNKIAEIWEYICDFEESAKNVERIKDDIYFGSRKIEVSEFAKKVFKEIQYNNDKYKKVINIINKNRFWVGENKYSKINEYLKTTVEYMKALKEPFDLPIKEKVPYNGNDVIIFDMENSKYIQRVEKLKKEREMLRDHITDVRNYLLNE